MVHRDPLDATGLLTELARVVRADSSVSDVLHDVVCLARRNVPGVDDASITMIKSRKASTVAAAGEMSLVLDELQYDEGYGPCLDAARADDIRHIDDAATEERWPRYIPRAYQAGLRSSLSLPLPVDHYLLGALNLYATQPHSFNEDSIAVAEAFAAHATAVLSHAETSDVHRRRADHLERALQSRSVIDQAKGIIMAQHKCDGETAFGMLRTLSQRENVKLYELAAQLVISASNHPLPTVPAYRDDVQASAR